MASPTTYELGILTTGVTAANAALEVVAGAAKPMSILEMGFSLNAATATTLTLGRPGNTPTTGTLVTATAPIDLPPRRWSIGWRDRPRGLGNRPDRSHRGQLLSDDCDVERHRQRRRLELGRGRVDGVAHTLVGTGVVERRHRLCSALLHEMGGVRVCPLPPSTN